MKSDYEKLNLEPGASLEEVKKSYRSQVKYWHPDRFPSVSPRLQKKAHEKIREINEAYKKIERALKSENHSSQFSKRGLSIPVNPEPTTLTWPNGDRYVGEIKNGIMHGRGTYFYSQGDQYSGEFRNGKPNGRGTFSYASGDVYTGQFLDDVMDGQGIYVYANGTQYTGEFKHGKPHGNGVYTLPDGKQFTGRWKNGELLD